MPRRTLYGALCTVVLAAMVAIAPLPGPKSALAFIDFDTMSIFSEVAAVIDIGDTLGSPGEGGQVSVYLENYADSIQGFTISVTLSRPDLMLFIAQTTIDTCYPCLDSACDVIDTVMCTTEVVPSTTQNTLIQNWDHAEARTFGQTNVLISGIADVDFDHSPLPILPNSDGVLIKVIPKINCDILDTLTNRTVILDINPVQTFLTDPSGRTIPEYRWTDADTAINGVDTTISIWLYHPTLQLLNGSITIPFTLKGDLNKDGVYNIVDVVSELGVAFRGVPEPCPPGIADLDCSGAADIVDVVILINHAFRGGPAPFC